MGRQLRRDVSRLAAALGRCCPACGEGRLYVSYLKVADRCPVCDLDFHAEETGDGPAVFIILIVGFIVVGLALWLEMTLSPPMWLHMVLWLPLILGLSLGLLPLLKAWMVAQHYRHDLLDEDIR